MIRKIWQTELENGRHNVWRKLTDDGTVKSIDLSFCIEAFEFNAFQQSIELSKFIAWITSLIYSISTATAQGWCHARTGTMVENVANVLMLMINGESEVCR